MKRFIIILSFLTLTASCASFNSQKQEDISQYRYDVPLEEDENEQ